MSDKKHCCAVLETEVTWNCNEHSDPFDCPDHTVYYSSEFNEYGILIHDGGSSYSVIHFCPWCGTKLPTSKRSTGALTGRKIEIA